MDISNTPAVNYHIIKACNMRCKFCFATFSDLPNIKINLSESLEIIQLLWKHGFTKLNIVGGEPTLVQQLPEILDHAKSIGFVTSIVTNGALLSNEKIFGSISTNLDWIGLSIDSVDEEINRDSGRQLHSKTVLSRGYYRDLCLKIKDAGLKLKINTVVSSYNKGDRMVDFINEVKPDRWKIMQAMYVEGQNNLAQNFLASDEAYHLYLLNNKTAGLSSEPIEESSKLIRGSYLMVSPEGKFFDSDNGSHTYSDPIIKVGVSKALDQIQFNQERFLARGGLYKW